MHQIFSILTHCSAFKSGCLLQWDTGKALLLNLYFFFRVWRVFFFLNPLLPVFTSWLPCSTYQLAIFDYCQWGEIHQCTSVLYTRTMFLFQDSFCVRSAWTGVHFVWGKVNRINFRMMCFSVLKQHYSGLYPPPFRLWKDVSLKELNMEIKADLY